MSVSTKIEVDKLMENKSANHYLVPGWTSVHPVGVPATVHTQVFQPGGIVPGVHPVFGQPHGFVATTEYPFNKIIQLVTCTLLNF